MPAGLTIINDNGLYQIDENTYSLAVLQHGTYNSLTNGIISTTVPNPVFAAYIPLSSNFIGGIGDITVSGGTTSAELVLMDAIGSPTGVTTDVKWFVLGRPTVQTSGAGLEVYDASGALKYSSLWKTKTIAGWAGSTLNVNKRYAVIGGDVGRRTVYDIYQLSNQDWETHITVFGLGYYSGSGGVFGSEVFLEESFQSGGGGSSYEELFGNSTPPLVIDVTEYT